MKDNTEQKRLLGIWDLSVARVSLGTVLIFAAELMARRFIHKNSTMDVCLLLNDSKSSNRGKKIYNKFARDILLIKTILNLEGMDRFYLFHKFSDLKDHIKINHCYTWPQVNSSFVERKTFDNILYIQDFYKRYGFIPFLYCKKQPLNKALNFLKEKTGKHIPVVVHLKNIPKMKNCSNANQFSWFKFIKYCSKYTDIVFVLIGDDKIEKRIHILPNVILSREDGSDLPRDLALIQLAFLFMGMSSGPCNMALFSDTPYIIFKNPKQHAKQIERELGEGGSFIFVRPDQHFLRLNETKEILIREFENLYKTLDKQKWMGRLN